MPRRSRRPASRLCAQASQPKGPAAVVIALVTPSKVGALWGKRERLRAAMAGHCHRHWTTEHSYIRALSRWAGARTFTLVLQDPRTGLRTADMIWVPEHDLLRGPNVITTLTAPHSFSQDRLSELRKALPGEIAALPRPRVAILLGGPTRACRYGEADLDRFGRALASVAALNPSFLITPSRRTPMELTNVADAATRSRPRLLWAGGGENPYPSFLAHADVLIVTADSINMTSEACATWRPVYVFQANLSNKH